MTSKKPTPKPSSPRLANKYEPQFRNREHAGTLLAERVDALALSRPLVLAIPRGGLPVAQAVARFIHADLDIAPGPETEFREATEYSGLTADRSPESFGFDPRGRDIVLVEDGISSGVTVLAAARGVRARGAGRVIIAAPVVCGSAVDALLGETGFELVALHVCDAFDSLGDFFKEFDSVKDIEVHRVREAARAKYAARFQSTQERVEKNV